MTPDHGPSRERWRCPVCDRLNYADHDRCNYFNTAAHGDDTERCPGRRPAAEAARRLAEEVMRYHRGDILTIPSNPQPVLAVDTDGRVLARVPEVDALVTLLGMTKEERALIAWLVRHPDDRGAVMALADWLEENDRTEGAARMREVARKREDA